MSAPREPDALDLGVRRVIAAALARSGCEAVVQSTWSTDGRMWWLDVSPTIERGAPLSIGSCSEDDLLTVHVGRTWFEIFGVHELEPTLDHLTEIVEAVLAGEIREVGLDKTSMRIRTPTRVIRVGALRLPIPWRVRRVRTYAPYEVRR